MTIVTGVGTRGESSECWSSQCVLFNICISCCGGYSHLLEFLVIFSLRTHSVLFVASYLYR